jgi:hypothetical protein
MTGDMRDFIKELTQHKTMRTIIRKNDIRFMYADWIAHIVCLKINKSPFYIQFWNFF